jgi:hypothetical protein
MVHFNGVIFLGIFSGVYMEGAAGEFFLGVEQRKRW